MAEKNSWVKIKKVVLESGQRSDRLPEETRNVPFVTWVKGSLAAEGNVGDTVKVITKTGRLEEGELVEVNPMYELNYGSYVGQLQHIGDDVRAILFGEGAKQ
jgi:hypothetical protein